MVKYSFPNVFIGLGSDNGFVRDIQRALGIEATGVFDFLTMCYIVCHKHRNGLNHDEPIVDQSTWDSLMGTDSNQQDVNTPDVDRVDRDGEGTPAPAQEGVINRDDLTPAPAARNEEGEAPAPADQNATTTGVTASTPDNRPEEVTANPDKPREDQPTITAEEQQRTNPPELDTRLATAAEPERTEQDREALNEAARENAGEEAAPAPETPTAEPAPAAPENGEAGNDNRPDGTNV